ncbi:Phage anti-sigma factor [Yersinia phage fPS-65]|uniref:Phage anti-sigma factor n=1 Tax=Yersinia phage fPS-65 TaxID=2052931 RepID=A0A449C5H7_9CAUD|nr:Phage anti-sigma factor [Yersinia phage fPS-65]VEV89598.1 Phage anti-sigma factor [Yersinia phage fPS-65]
MVIEHNVTQERESFKEFVEKIFEENNTDQFTNQTSDDIITKSTN